MNDLTDLQYGILIVASVCAGLAVQGLYIKKSKIRRIRAEWAVTAVWFICAVTILFLDAENISKTLTWIAFMYQLRFTRVLSKRLKP